MFNLISTRTIVAASLALAGGAHAMSTAPVGNGSDYPPYLEEPSQLTRAQVRAEFTEARNSDMLLLKGDEFQTTMTPQGMPLSRAEVIRAATQARMDGTLPHGDGFGE